MKQTPYQKQLDAMTLATEQAGEIAKEFQAKGFKQLDMKTKGDPFLTEADIAVDTHLKTTLMAAFPEYGWYSEETPPTDGCLKKEFCWVVDPIDGTREFIDRNGEFSISVGLVHRGKPIAGVVYAPMRDHFISGAKGTGVRVNGLAIKPWAAKPVDESDILISRSETNAGLWQPYADVLKTRVVGSAAYKIALAAAGFADATASLKPKNLWDVCAGHFLIEEAGGHFMQLDGSSIEYHQTDFRLSNFVAAPTKGYATQLAAQLRG